MKTLTELKAMRRNLTRHDYRYYILCMPIISDQVYDHMVKDYDQQCYNFKDGQEWDVEGQVGQNTRSLEWEASYPQWVQEEFKDVQPMT